MQWVKLAVISAYTYSNKFMSEHFLGFNFVSFTSLFKIGLVMFRWFSVKNARGEESILTLYEHFLPFRILHVVARFCLLSSTVLHVRLVPIISQNKYPVVISVLYGAPETCPYSNVPVRSLWFLLVSLMFHVRAFGDITDNKWIVSFVSTMILSIGNELRNLCYFPSSYTWLNKIF
jgi:hypothetical protein